MYFDGHCFGGTLRDEFAGRPNGTRYPVDPNTRWAIGAQQTPADELKKRLEAGNMLIIDVRSPAQFAKETLPGAINVPMAELEAQLKSVSKETYIVFT